MSESLKVLVYGATGSQASPVVHHLLANGHEAHALTREPGSKKCEPLEKAGANLVAADMADLQSLITASEGMDAVAFMIPAFIENPMNYPLFAKNAITAAKEAGVKLIVWNTSGPVIPERIGNPMYDLRLDIGDMLAESSVPYIILQPTAYMENLLGPWTRPSVAEKDELPYPVPEDIPLAWIASDDLGKLTVAALERPELANSRIVVSGIENVTGPELAAQFSEGLGREITYRAMPLEEFAAVMDQVFGQGVGDVAAAGYRFQNENRDLFTMAADMEAVLKDLPVQMTTLAEWAARHRMAFS
ncbi:MAG: NmrA family NAD(P)-binding protein [Candidatus Promineifilaceae bacterium]|nr:NmrA family NAD(P)-binding protein [Candidatus Promineifilaceae bacterium]